MISEDSDQENYDLNKIQQSQAKSIRAKIEEMSLKAKSNWIIDSLTN